MRVATPLLLVLLVVELSDVVFAVDSIPAVSAPHHCATPAARSDLDEQVEPFLLPRSRSAPACALQPTERHPHPHSVLQVFGVTRDPFIVYTSNLWAILSLRGLYGFVSTFMQQMRYLDKAGEPMRGAKGGQQGGRQAGTNPAMTAR